ncbi:Ribosomal RNA small subunit methyltransferase A [Candidatus Sulfotelmatobacter kueseliae]|uniref:Ribosomal RNA small subunit methyltransferase A n=1 Tax=Candidatus Sulfotelmatobacter kueseliae TaxID=2042962 RepID=A0A2U3K666_9BACT|nr:Ribosomal RNA small subunit methyltransferase A [Candidatus Sulfotelmatobacter kueseliae]
MPKVSAARPPQAKPKLGQHFLNSQDLAARIVEALGDISQDTVLEIGPGRGILTSLLAKRARRLIAVELDRVLAAQLSLKFAMARNVEIIEADILAIDFDSFFGPKPGLGRPGIEIKPEPVKVVGNLPYYITSDILLRLFEFSKHFESIVIMVQREVADRIAAEPGGRDYGVLSATTQLYARVEKLFTLPPGAFTPPPKVYSTLLRLTIDPQMDRLGVAGDGFIDFLRLSFGQKRKTLWNNLKTKFPDTELKRALAEARVKPTARAETLSLEESAAVYRALRNGAGARRIT